MTIQGAPYNPFGKKQNNSFVRESLRNDQKTHLSWLKIISFFSITFLASVFIFNSFFIQDHKKDALNAIQEYNNSARNLHSIVSQSGTQSTIDSLVEETSGDVQKNMIIISEVSKDMIERPSRDVDPYGDITDVSEQVIRQFLICDSVPKIPSNYQSQIGDITSSCEVLSSNAYNMAGHIRTYNHFAQGFSGKISVGKTNPMTDIWKDTDLSYTQHGDRQYDESPGNEKSPSQ